MEEDPHRGQRVVRRGSGTAKAAAIFLHGRGASAASILSLADALGRDDFLFLAPEAAGNTWYPFRFLEKRERNEPFLSSALALIDRLVGEIGSAGIAADRTLILGFSQGACLASEFAARHPRRYGGIVALSGGLIGDQIDPSLYSGDLRGTPAFFGCSNVDPYSPLERVQISAEVLRKLGADVTLRIYPGMAHTVNAEELEHIGGLMRGMLER
jgi:predicted esterase